MSAGAHDTKPMPRITPDNAPFWDGCRRHVLTLPWCPACDRAHFPPGPVCPTCFGDRIEWREASGRGTVSTFVVVHREWLPAFRDDLPYNVVQVELEEGPRLTANVIGVPNSELRVGLPVEVTFDDVSETVALPRFRPRG
jgi:uncharacterized OB-fold protein